MSFPVKMLAVAAGMRGLRCLVIGGHAVNAYAPPRATLDLDLLARAEDREAWRKLVEEEGYRLLNDGGTFLQFSPPYGVTFRLDFMLVNDTTFAKLIETARPATCLGIQAMIPSAIHLVALKLHAIRHGPDDRKDKDWLDIKNLVTFAGLDPHGAAIKQVFDRQGTPELYTQFLEKVRHARPS